MSEHKRPMEDGDSYSIFDAPDARQTTKTVRSTNRKRTLLVAVLAVVAAAAVCAVTLLLIPPQEALSSAGEQTEVSYTLLKHESTVSQVAITNASGSYTVVYNDQDKAYELAGYEDLMLDSYDVEALTDGASTFTAFEKLLQVTALQDYGLDEPAVTTRITYADGATETILIGNKTHDESGYYATVNGTDVYVISESMASSFTMAAVEYVNTTLLTAPTTKTDDTDGKAVLKELKLTGLAFDTPLTIRRASTDDATEYSYFSYVITAPYFRGVSETASTELAACTSLLASSAVVLHPTKQQLNQFGFDKPGVVAELSVSIETSGDTENAVVYYNTITTTIRVGSTDQDGNYYVMVDDTDAIFLVAKAQLSGIAERRYKNTSSDLLFLKDVTTLSQVQFSYEGNTYSYDLSHHPDEESTDKKMTVTAGTKTYPTEDFRTLYQLSMNISRYGDTDKKPTGQPALSVKTYLKDGSLYFGADIYATGANLYTVHTSHDELFTVKASQIVDFIKQAKNFENGDTVLGI